MTVQAHQGFLRAFNSVTNTTGHKNNILKAWKDMSSVPPEQVTRYDMTQLRLVCGHFRHKDITAAGMPAAYECCWKWLHTSLKLETRAGCSAPDSV